MNLLTYGLIGTRNLFQARRRTILLASAIVAVTTLFVLLRAGARSVSDRMIESATALSSGHVNVGGFFKLRRKGADPLIIEKEALKNFIKTALPEAVSVIDRGRGWGRIISRDSSINAGLSGIDHQEESRLFSTLKLAKQKEYKQEGADDIKGSFENMKKSDQILLFASQAKKLSVEVGDHLTIVSEASGGSTNTLDVTVGAIASDMGFSSNWSMFVSKQTILSLYHIDPNTTGVIQIFLKDIKNASQVMSKLKGLLEEKGYVIMEHDPRAFFMKFDKVMGEDWLGQKLDLTIWSDEVSYLMWITTAFDFLSYMILMVLAGIISGGIGNSMWMAVRERTKEIGTMRAIGVQKRQIAFLFLFEAFSLGALAAALGGLIGAVIVLLVNALHIPIKDPAARAFLMANDLKLSFEPAQIFITVLLFGIIAAVASFNPAIKAAKLDPAKSLT